jgi:5-methylcytosine-specific restriction protein A
MDERGSRAVFTIWKDKIVDQTTQLTSTDPDVTKRRGYTDQERVINAVIRDNLPAYGMICEAADPNVNPRSIKLIDSTYVVRLSITRNRDGLAIAKHLEKVHFADVARNDLSSAIDDLGSSAPPGNQAPDRALHTGLSFKRDPKVRAYVIQRAKGYCEYCGKRGFQMTNGQHYVEAHHIIALAEQGPDTPENVIALCPNHHREAHFGLDAEALERTFLNKLKSFET